MSTGFPRTLQLTSLTSDQSPSTLNRSGVTNLTHNLPGDSFTCLHPKAMWNFVESLKIQGT